MLPVAVMVEATDEPGEIEAGAVADKLKAGVATAVTITSTTVVSVIPPEVPVIVTGQVVGNVVEDVVMVSKSVCAATPLMETAGVAIAQVGAV